MALNATAMRDPLPPIELRDDDRFAGQLYDPAPRSHFTAFLMGGVVVASGLLAFLYYDTDNLNAQAGRDLMTTGSIARSETAIDARVPNIRTLPPIALEPARP